jgi:hypothetical protein
MRLLLADPQRAGRAAGGGAAGPLRRVLQVHAADHRGAQAQDGPGRHDRGRRRRQPPLIATRRSRRTEVTSSVRFIPSTYVHMMMCTRRLS